MSRQLIILDVETRDAEAIYWIGSTDGKREFGVIFEGPITNIARQSVAESVVFSMALANDMVEQIEPK